MSWGDNGASRPTTDAYRNNKFWDGIRSGKQGVRMEWIDIKNKEPECNQNVIAVGTWEGEINGSGESEYMGIGAWNGKCVAVDSDTYTLHIVDITHWMPLPSYPKQV